MCPGENERYHKLKISHDGTVNRNSNLKDLCLEIDFEPEYHSINIAYNNYPPYFKFDDESKAMIEYPLPDTDPSENLRLSKEHPMSVYSGEILKLFFKQFNLVPNWIFCQQTWGWFDGETGKWTGAVGKVNITFSFKSNNS